MLSTTNPIEVRSQAIATTLERVREHHDGLPDPESMLSSQLYALYDEFGDLSSIQGKRILDIGCGCNGGTLEVESNARWRVFEPWLSRTIQLLGGEPVGVDIGRLEGETFETHQIDLLSSDPLEGFDSGAFDGINCRLVLSSPHLVRLTTRERRRELKDYLLSEVDRLLVPGGKIIIFDEDIEAP